MTRDELIKTAIKTVIQYAEEQGVKLRRIDFLLSWALGETA
jgi:hypothetical protein